MIAANNRSSSSSCCSRSILLLPLVLIVDQQANKEERFSALQIGSEIDDQRRGHNEATNGFTGYRESKLNLPDVSVSFWWEL